MLRAIGVGMSKLCLSYSGIKTFLQCPHRFYRTKVKKDVADDYSHPATVWGNEVHKALEDFFIKGKPLGERFNTYQKYADALEAMPGRKFIELKLAINEDEQVVPFFSKEAAYRGILDFLKIEGDTAYLIDHKTGKVRPTKQLHFNALLIFAAFPGVKHINAAFFWLPADTYTKHRFSRDDIEDLWDEFETAIVGIETAQENDKWIRKPSGLCPWCPVKDCEHWGPR